MSAPALAASRHAFLPDPFVTRSGEALYGARIAHETWGALNAERDNAILLFTGLSPSAHAASSALDPSPGWWQDIIGPGRPLDTDRYLIVCVNSLGGCFGSTGPASASPVDGAAYRLRFPRLAIEDIARAGMETLRTLGVERADTVIGPSLGGMVVLAYAALFPGRARRLISISGTAAASPVALALRAVQREAILRDPDWQGGNYPPSRPPVNGLSIARKLGTITYRSALEWQQRFGRQRIDAARRGGDPFAAQFEIESYLQAQAERFATSFDANCYLYLSRAMDAFDLAEHGSAHELFVRAKLQAALVIGAETDMLFRIEEQAAIAYDLQRASIPTTFVRATSAEGHDAFLVDLDTFGNAIRSFLNAS